ncbi:hypothetical protein [Virgibacillus doumboii]|uniref:hypothetical protein n=1 Tax=Virgibacillus doumboii TaxID=2697503 RepID=UPI0013DF6DAB|nr:hypothetical protein [Virgibacillus doumboii]
MTRRFTLTFQDFEDLEFFDILSLEDKQINEVLAIASQHTKKQLQEYETKGFDISYLTVPQKHRVIVSKNRVVFKRSPDELRRQKRVVVTLHSQQRVLERVDSNELETILDIIQRIIDSDKVLKAQFKGYSSLSFTLIKDGDPALYKLPISFKWIKGRRQILSVTVTHRNAPPSKMRTKIANNHGFAERMVEYRRKLVEQSQKNKGHK